MINTEHIYGIRAVIEALRSGRPIEKIYLQKGLGGDLFRELEKRARKSNVSISYVPVERLNRYSKHNHQGAIAIISPVEYHNFELLIQKVLKNKSLPLFLLLDGISDVRNFGAIIRTAECTGVDGIVIARRGAAPVNAATVKTSAGAVFSVPICKVAHIKDAVYYLQGSGVKVVAITEKTNSSVFQTDFSGPVALVLGAEDSGIHPSTLKVADEKARLPMEGTIDSLNVSVACGVVLYEVLRQRLPG